MKVIFDFDDVIFDAKSFKVSMFQILAERGYKNLEVTYELARKNGRPFSLHEFIKSIDALLSSEEEEEIYQKILAVSEHMINHEVFAIMKSLGKDNSYIVTSGDSEYQMDKIQRSIGLNVVREVMLVSGSKKEEIKAICNRHADEEVIFVDDKLHFFNDIDMEACPNLKTVFFGDNGMQTLVAEITESRRMESMKSEASKPELGESFGMH
jgi:FMN phosphatase YigB (HAD superfamily)